MRLTFGAGKLSPHLRRYPLVLSSPSNNTHVHCCTTTYTSDQLLSLNPRADNAETKPVKGDGDWSMLHFGCTSKWIKRLRNQYPPYTWADKTGGGNVLGKHYDCGKHTGARSVTFLPATRYHVLCSCTKGLPPLANCNIFGLNELGCRVGGVVGND